VVVADGVDWSMPEWVRPAEFSGFFSESASPTDHVQVRSVDMSWRQIAPSADGPLDLSSTGEAQGLFFDPLGQQLAEPGRYWVRVFASGVDWAPEWVVEKCGVEAIGTDYDDQEHLPIWDDCVWSALRDTWEKLLVDEGLLADPDFAFAYVPGGFTWSEFDYEMVTSAVDAGELTQAGYLAWYDQMLGDFVELAGPAVGRMVFTGEDYPWGPFDQADDLLATRAVERGLGIRTGITELSNFHLSETPAYGSTVTADGHLRVDDAVHRPGTVVATENECYVSCGYSAEDPEYAVVMSNLKALHLRMNWMYVVPGDSLLDQTPEHWDWVRLSLGQPAERSPDAWVALRDAEDQFWREETGPFAARGRAWRARPFVRNLERWLVQVDVPRAVARRSTVEVHRGDPEPENGVAFEGLSTNASAGSRGLAFRVAPQFLPAGRHDVLLKVTYWDGADGSFRVRNALGSTQSVRFSGKRAWRTATFRMNLPVGQRLAGKTDFWIEKQGPGDATFNFVRVLRLNAP